jgi:hypothetical protein
MPAMLKSTAFAFALLSASTAALDAQGAAAAYAPGTHRYRVTRESKSTQEMMGQTQSGTVSTFEEFTLDLRPGGRDTMRFSITFDSASRQSDIPGAGETPPAKGRRISGQISPRGVVQQFDKDTTAVDDISAGYRTFLPHLPTGTITLGTTWTDTVRTPFSQGGIEGTTITIIASRVLGDTTIAGQKAWRVERTGALSMSGAGNQNGADLVLAGTGTANGISYLGTSGTYLGAASTQNLKMSIQVPAASMTIPIDQTTVTKVERVAAPPSR